MELFKEILLLWCFTCTAPSSATFHPAVTTGYLRHTAKVFFPSANFIPSPSGKLTFSPGKKGLFEPESQVSSEPAFNIKLHIL